MNRTCYTVGRKTENRMDEEMQEIEIEATELLARACCHEIDHLDGIMYTALVEDGLHPVNNEEE